MIHIVHLVTGLDQRSHLLDGSFHSPGDLVHILRLDDSFEIILQNLREVI